MRNLTTINHLKEQNSIKNFVEKTVNQLNKDLFGLIDEEIGLPPVEALNSLDLLIVEVQIVLKNFSEGHNLQQFVYKVDLNEKNWHYFTAFQNYEKLAEDIIIREAQKVYLREMFKP